MEIGYTIPRDQNLPPGRDFDLLKREGIALLQQFSGDIWTDYNDHDPGVTLLEQLCFSLTDASYRSSFGIEEILAAGRAGQYDTFFASTDIFTSQPITLNDYRKLLIDQIPEVKNAWVEPKLNLIENEKGIYQVYLQLEEGVEEKQWPLVEKKVWEKLNVYRNLGEDFGKIDILAYEDISFSATIELSYNAMGEEVLGKILASIEDYLSPHIRKYALQELLDAGERIEDILEGPMLHNGFIKEKDLHPRTRLIRTSKFTEIITSTPGVERINYFELRKNGITFLGDTLTLTDGRIPRLVNYLDPVKDRISSQISFLKGGRKYSIDTNLTNQIYASHAAQFHATSVKHSNISQLPRLTKTPAQANKMEIDRYFSMQRHMPAIYGVGEQGLPMEVSLERDARAKHLKAYLLIFDQLLANYLAQLANVSSLFSLDASLDQSYFFQTAFDIPNVASVLKNPKKSSYWDDIETHYHDLKRIFTSFQVSFDWEVEEQTFKKAASEDFNFDDALESLCKKLRDGISQKFLPPYSNEVQRLKQRLNRAIVEFRAACVRSSFRTNLEYLIRSTDPFVSRRNQFLDHLLARFGETLENLNPRLLAKGGSNSYQTDLIDSKIKLLRKYDEISRNRSRGTNMLAAKSSVSQAGLQLKLEAILNLKTEHENLADFVKKGAGGSSAHPDAKVRITERKPRAKPRAGKTRFSFSLPKKDREKILAALMAEGLHDYNYQIVESFAHQDAIKESFDIEFHHPEWETSQKIAQLPTEEEAKQALQQLVAYLQGLNQEGEGFHLIEHILLRPIAPDAEVFHLLNGRSEVMMRSYQARDKASQQFLLNNIILYATRGTALMIYDKNGSYRPLFENEVTSYEQIDPEYAEYKPFEPENGQWELVSWEIDENGERIKMANLIEEKVYLFDQSALSFRIREHAEEMQADGEAYFEVILWGEDENNKEVEVGRLVNIERSQQGRGEATTDNPGEEFLFETIEAAEKQRSAVLKEFIDMRFKNTLLSRLQVDPEKRAKQAADFYTQKCSLVFPNWPARFQSPDFKKQIEQLVIQHAPAHMAFNYLWLDPLEMKVFEKRLATWRKLKSQGLSVDKFALDQASFRLTDQLQQHQNS